MADIIGSEQKEKSLYLLQINYLEEQLERFQLKHDELKKQNEDLDSRCSALEKDKKDAAGFLKRAMVAKKKRAEELAEELAEQLQSHRRAAEQDREALKLQHGRHVKELQEKLDVLNSESVMLEAKLQERREMNGNQSQLVSDMENLRKQLDCEREDHLVFLDSLKSEMEWIRESNNRKSEMDKKMAEDSVELNTSETLREERAHYSERLKWFKHLLEKNLALKEENDVQDTESDLCLNEEQMKEELIKILCESSTHKKEVKQLMKEKQQLEAELEERSATHRRLLAETDALRQHLASELEKCCGKASESAQLRPYIQRESSRRRQLEQVMQEAIIILRHILTDPGKTSKSKLLRLLEMLNSTVPW